MSHYPSSGQFTCYCQKMQSYGISCGHQIIVLLSLNMDELTTSLLLYRWSTTTKDRYKGLNIATSKFWDLHFRELCNLGTQSAEDFNYVKEKVSEHVQYLKNKNLAMDTHIPK